jgi:hypothetical protein
MIGYSPDFPGKQSLVASSVKVKQRKLDSGVRDV